MTQAKLRELVPCERAYKVSDGGNGGMPISNNRAENHIWPIALGS